MLAARRGLLLGPGVWAAAGPGGRHRHRERGKDVYVSLTGDLLYGILPVSLAVKAGRREIHRVYYSPGSTRAEEVAESARAGGIQVVTLGRQALDSLCRQADRYKEHHVHQGLVADVSRLHHLALDFTRPQAGLQDALPPDREEPTHRPPLWLLLCSVRDPINLGTILRTSHFLGVDRVLVTGARCDLSCVVSKASVGALEVTPVWAVTRPTAFLQERRAAGWTVAASALEGGGLQTMQVSQVELGALGPTVLVLGSEGAGIPQEVLEQCTLGLTIPPGRGKVPQVDSLNVSVAAGLLLYSLLGGH